jgi:hypothetical protein
MTGSIDKKKRMLEDAIFVSVASYRDRDCKNTIASIFEQADNPTKVFVGTCEQNNPDQPDEKCDARVTERDLARVRTISMRETEARGPTYARYLCATLWRDEQYFLQLDSHMRLVKGWDRKCKDMVRKLQQQTHNKRVVLSTYVAGMEQHEGHERQDKEVTSRSPRMCQAFFNADGMISFHGAHLLDNTGDLVAVPFVAGGFMFSEAIPLLREVPLDPYLDDVFVGEEILLSARLWTSGYDIYTPNENIAFHKFTRAGEPKFWDNERDDSAGMARVRYLLGLSKTLPPQAGSKRLAHYGMGTARSLEDFYSFAGIDIERKLTTKNFCGGELIPDPPDAYSRRAFPAAVSSVGRRVTRWGPLLAVVLVVSLGVLYLGRRRQGSTMRR